MDLVKKKKLQGVLVVYMHILQPAQMPLNASFISQPTLAFWSR